MDSMRAVKDASLSSKLNGKPPVFNLKTSPVVKPGTADETVCTGSTSLAVPFERKKYVYIRQDRTGQDKTPQDTERQTKQNQTKPNQS